MTRKLIDIRARLPRHKTRKWKTRNKADTIVVHTTASDNQDPFKTNAYHIKAGEQNHISKEGCPRICYHDYVTKDGTVYHCNNYTDWTWHAGLYNKRSIGVVMAFRGQDNDKPEPNQYLALIEHLVILCLYLKILPKRVIGHREIPGMWTLLGNGSKKYKKTCPGMSVDMDALRAEITTRLQRRLAAEGLYDGKIDGNFGCLSCAALAAFKPIESKARNINWGAYRE